MLDDTSSKTMNAFECISMHKLNEKRIPPSIYYVPDFINDYEEKTLLTKVENSPKPKWTYLSNRRLQNWGGLPHVRGMMKEPLPDWLQSYCDKLGAMNVFDGYIPNHVLVNEYLPGQGIMPHEDGLLFYPTVATINLGSHAVTNFYEKRDKNNISMPDYLREETDTEVSNCGKQCMFSLLVKPKSLLVLKENAYTEYMHGIDERTQDIIDANVANLSKVPDVFLNDNLIRETRISLTIRYVPKVLKTTISLFKK